MIPRNRFKEKSYNYKMDLSKLSDEDIYAENKNILGLQQRIENDFFRNLNGNEHCLKEEFQKALNILIKKRNIKRLVNQFKKFRAVDKVTIIHPYLSDIDFIVDSLNRINRHNLNFIPIEKIDRYTIGEIKNL